MKSHSRFQEFYNRIGKAGNTDAWALGHLSAFLEGERYPVLDCMEWGRDMQVTAWNWISPLSKIA